MKALEKDRTRRYETANGLAHDLENYLHDEPVLACPPSAAYRLRKFTRRNKGPVLAVTLVLLALVAGVVGTTLGLLQARTQRQEAEASEKNAAEEAAVAKAVKGFLQQDLLGLAGPHAQLKAQIEPDPNVKLMTLLDRGGRQVDELFVDQPGASRRCSIPWRGRRTASGTCRCRTFVGAGPGVRRERFGPEHPATLAEDRLAHVYGSAGQYKGA